jgi:hypothetical protein
MYFIFAGGSFNRDNMRNNSRGGGASSGGGFNDFSRGGEGMDISFSAILCYSNFNKLRGVTKIMGSVFVVSLFLLKMSVFFYMQ